LKGVFTRLLAVVRRIPRGRVATYGQVAALAGLPRYARHVGYALHAQPAGTPLPWHRVVNARGGISVRPWDGGAETQRLRLEAEGVQFDARGRVPLERYGWKRAGGTRNAVRPDPVARRSAAAQRLAAPRRSATARRLAAPRRSATARRLAAPRRASTARRRLDPPRRLG